MVQLICPFKIDYTTGVTVFGYTIDETNTNVDYVLDMYSYYLTASALSNTYHYMNDPDSFLPLFRVYNQSEAKVEDGVYFDYQYAVTAMNTNGPKPYFDGSNTVPANGTFGKMIVQMVASCLFGHPSAQAMIKNEASMIGSLTSKNSIAKPFVNIIRSDNVVNGDPVPNPILQSLFEQLFAAAPERFSVYDAELRKLPFAHRDVLVVDIVVTVNISNNNPSTLNSSDYISIPINVNTMFNGRVGYDRDNSRLQPRRIRVRMHLNRDIVYVLDPIVPSIYGITKPPQSDVAEKAWMYQKLSTDTLSSISWTLFRNMNTTGYKRSQLESCYIMLRVAFGSRIPWISVRTLPQADGLDASFSYRSQLNYKGYYNENYGMPNVSRDNKIIFYIGQNVPNLTFYNLINNNLLPAYNVETYNPTSPMNNVGPLDVQETISEIMIQTDPLAPPGEYLLWVYEIGYKFKDQEPVIVSYQ